MSTIEKLKKKHPVVMLKNGVYYLANDFGDPLFQYSKVTEKDDWRDILELYINYRLELTGLNVSQSQLLHVSAYFCRGVQAFKKGQPLIREISKTEDWLFLPTYLLLSLGSDSRSSLGTESHRNKYFTSTIPNNSIKRSSCTSSSISLDSYLEIECQHYNLIAEHLTGGLDRAWLFKDQKLKILTLFTPLRAMSIKSLEGSNLLLAPSGTDIEFYCTWLGVLRSKELSPGGVAKVTAVINAELEVGSGTKLAAGLYNFTGQAPSGVKLEAGSLMGDHHQIQVEVVGVTSRDESSKIVDPAKLESLLCEIVSREVRADKVVVLHLVHSTKTGVCIPSMNLVKRFQKTFSGKVVFVVDAAQGRINVSAIQQYLDQGVNIITTGSKFYAGAPFSGALLVSEVDLPTFINATAKLPGSFAEYFDQFGAGDLIKLESSKFKWSNWGLFFRWQSAIFEIESFLKVPNDFTGQLVERWRRNTVSLLEFSHDEILILKCPTPITQDNSSISKVNSIITFVIGKKESFTLEQLKRVHRLMVERVNGEQSFEIGQPVQVSSGAQDKFALRLALSSRNIVNAFRNSLDGKLESSLEYLFDQDKLLTQKLRSIIKMELENVRT